MKGLLFVTLAAFAACALAEKKLTDDDVEIIIFNEGKRVGRVWPTESGKLDENMDTYKACSELVLLIPGFLMGRDNADFANASSSVSANSNYNVFLVNYNNSYLLTAPSIAAPQIVDFLNAINAKYNADKSKVTLISFSLGTVVSGAVGRLLGGVGKIIAFDPCGLQFDYLPNSLRLDSSDADNLICMHTTDLVGTKRNKMCHANLFWDGGNYPHGCPDTNMVCGHVLAVEVLKRAFLACQYDFTLCDSYNAYKDGKCSGNPTLTLDVDMKVKPGLPTTGAKYFFDTPVDVPFTAVGLGFGGNLCLKHREIKYNGAFC